MTNGMADPVNITGRLVRHDGSRPEFSEDSGREKTQRLKVTVEVALKEQEENATVNISSRHHSVTFSIFIKKVEM